MVYINFISSLCKRTDSFVFFANLCSIIHSPHPHLFAYLISYTMKISSKVFAKYSSSFLF